MRQPSIQIPRQAFRRAIAPLRIFPQTHQADGFERPIDTWIQLGRARWGVRRIARLRERLLGGVATERRTTGEQRVHDSPQTVHVA